MSIPKLLTVEQVAEALDLSIATLDRYRANGTGPNFLRVGDGGNIRYLESDVIAYLESCRALPPIDGSKASTPAQIAAAMQSGSAERRAAMKARSDELQALSDADRVVEIDPSAIVTGFAGQAPGSIIERHWNVPPVAFDNTPPPHILKGR